MTDRCPTCKAPWADHGGIAVTCAEVQRLRSLLKRCVSGLKHVGSFECRSGDDPHPLDCSLAGRVSHVFGMGMTRAHELCIEFGEDPYFKNETEANRE